MHSLLHGQMNLDIASPAHLGVRAFHSCNGGCQFLWVVMVKLQTIHKSFKLLNHAVGSGVRIKTIWRACYHWGLPCLFFNIAYFRWCFIIEIRKQRNIYYVKFVYYFFFLFFLNIIFYWFLLEKGWNSLLSNTGLE